MPPSAGDYKYIVEYRQNGASKISTGTFHANDERRRGPIRVDAQYPWHFLWEGTGQHYFFNGTTAYWLMGWSDDKVIQSSIQRLLDLSINRLRVTIAGRTNLFYGEPVMVTPLSTTGPRWTVFLTPWPTKQAEDIFRPEFDYTRFDLSHWQRLDRALRFARDRDMIISLVLDMNDSRVHPAADSEDERRFIRYAVARFAAFAGNVEFKILSRTGRDISSISMFPSEREVLFPTGVQFYVLDRKSDPDTGRTIIEMIER